MTPFRFYGGILGKFDRQSIYNFYLIKTNSMIVWKFFRYQFYKIIKHDENLKLEMLLELNKIIHNYVIFIWHLILYPYKD